MTVLYIYYTLSDACFYSGLHLFLEATSYILQDEHVEKPAANMFAQVKPPL